MTRREGGCLGTRAGQEGQNRMPLLRWSGLVGSLSPRTASHGPASSQPGIQLKGARRALVAFTEPPHKCQ